MDNNQAMREFLREKVYREVIMKYLFIKTLEEKYDDEYIRTIYRINASAIRGEYNALSEDERKQLESNIRKQIESGEINLNKEAINWHRQSLHAKHMSEINEENNKKGEER